MAKAEYAQVGIEIGPFVSRKKTTDSEFSARYRTRI